MAMPMRASVPRSGTATIESSRRSAEFLEIGQVFQTPSRALRRAHVLEAENRSGHISKGCHDPIQACHVTVVP